MSVNLISGLQGSGKSFFCTRHIIDQLVETDRHIYTNIAIHPDCIARIVLQERYQKTGGFFYGSNISLILSRIHIFKAFTCRSDYLRFKRFNPLYCSLHLERNREYDVSRSGNQKLVFHLSEIFEFWDISYSNCLFYFDESYQFFKSSDGSKRDKDTKERRERLQTYILHHRHFDDDVYIISHKEEYLDKNILFGTRYVVRNMRNYPIIPEEVLAKYWWLRLVGSMTRPYQFFRAYVFVGDEKKYLSTRDVWPSSRIFRCYDSKAPAETLGKVITHNQESAESGDYGRSYFKELRYWFRDNWTQLLLAFFVIYSVCSVLWFLFRYNVTPEMASSALGKKDKKHSSLVSKNDKSKDLKGQKGQGGEPEKVKSITAVSPSAIYFSDNTCIRKGGKYEIKGVMCNVLDVNHDYVLFSVRDKKFKVSTRLLSRM
jgi:hypothetical protein